MNLTNENQNTDRMNRSQVEQVQKQKHEYKLAGSYLRRRGMLLFAYNSTTGEITEVKSANKPTLVLTTLQDSGETVEIANVDTRHTHFEAVNHRSATRRVEKYRAGIIKELGNLRAAGKTINFY